MDMELQVQRTDYKVICGFSASVFIEPINVSFFSITGWNIGLDYCDNEWFALEMNRDPSVVFEIEPKYCILNSFVD